MNTQFDFPAQRFDLMSEQDMREEVIARLLRRLGYRTGTALDVRRGQTLRYNRTQLGRRKPHDPELMGRPDYVCTAHGVCWTIEAKPPNESLDDLAVAQSRSYAMHPEICAAYHALSNGHEFVVLDTQLTAEEAPILRLRYEELEARWLELEAVLGGDALLRVREFRSRARGVPLGPGLEGVVEVASGMIRFKQGDRFDPYFAGVVKGGRLDRDNEGKLRLALEVTSGMPALQDLHARIGFGRIEFVCDDDQLSLTGSTTFTGSTSFTLPRGAEWPWPHEGRMLVLRRDQESTLRVQAIVTLRGRGLCGEWRSTFHAPGLAESLGFTPSSIAATSIDGEVDLRLS